MNVLFLDIDGVLNSEKYFLSLKEEHMLKMPLDHRCVERVKRIVDETGAKIVISSSWRTGWDKDPARNMEEGRLLDEIFQEHGLSIYDKTPVSPQRKRPLEIKEWLEQCDQKVHRFVILDDCDFHWKDYRLHGHWVATDFASSGLTDEKADEVIALFKKSFFYFLKRTFI